MDELLTAAENEVIELRKQKSSTMQARMTADSERAARVADEISLAVGQVTGDLYGNVDVMNEFSAELLVRQGAAAAADEGEADLKELVRKLVKEHMLQELATHDLIEEAELDAQIAASPIIQRPFCGPLMREDDREPEMQFAATKRARTRTRGSTTKREALDQIIEQIGLCIVRVQASYLQNPMYQNVIRDVTDLMRRIADRDEDCSIGILRAASDTELEDLNRAMQSTNADFKNEHFSQIAFAAHYRMIAENKKINDTLTALLIQASDLVLMHDYGTPEGNVSWAALSNVILRCTGRRGVELGHAQASAGHALG
jgi:hypothetical protein